MFGGFNWGDPAPCNEYTCMTTEYAIALVQRTKLFGLKPEAFWLDAGWYAEAADHATGKNWYNTVGNWKPDPERFPAGFKPISDYIHEKADAKFMVWFEPERVYKGSQWERQHPEWMLAAGGDNRLLNIGIPDACKWLSQTIGNFLEENGIDYYRQDFNIAPESIWLANDTEGRRGMTEVKYIMGLYDYWDYLLTRFPQAAEGASTTRPCYGVLLCGGLITTTANLLDTSAIHTAWSSTFLNTPQEATTSIPSTRALRLAARWSSIGS